MNGQQPDIELGAGVNNASVEEIRQSALFIQWWERITSSGEIEVKKVNVVAVYKWGKPREIRMMQLVAESCDPEGRKLGGIATLRGDTVDVLTILTCLGRDYVVLVSQPRVPGGQRVVSNPSGMLDGGEAKATAFRELEEELGIKWPWGELIDLSEAALGHQFPYIVSSGTSDERVYMMLTTAEVTPALLNHLNGKYGGLQDEGEQTQVIVVPIEEAFGVLESYGSASMKSVQSLLLYQMYRRKISASKRRNMFVRCWQRISVWNRQR